MGAHHNLDESYFNFLAVLLLLQSMQRTSVAT